MIPWTRLMYSSRVTPTNLRGLMSPAPALLLQLPLLPHPPLPSPPPTPQCKPTPKTPTSFILHPLRLLPFPSYLPLPPPLTSSLVRAWTAVCRKFSNSGAFEAITVRAGFESSHFILPSCCCSGDEMVRKVPSRAASLQNAAVS